MAKRLSYFDAIGKPDIERVLGKTQDKEWETRNEVLMEATERITTILSQLSFGDILETHPLGDGEWDWPGDHFPDTPEERWQMLRINCDYMLHSITESFRALEAVSTCPAVFNGEDAVLDVTVALRMLWDMFTLKHTVTTIDFIPAGEAIAQTKWNLADVRRVCEVPARLALAKMAVIGGAERGARIWSPGMTFEQWVAAFERAGHELSLSTLKRRIDEGKYIAHPDRSRGGLRLKLSSLPPGMQSEEFWTRPTNGSRAVQ